MLRGSAVFVIALTGVLHAQLIDFTDHPYPDVDVGDVANVGVHYTGRGPHLDEYFFKILFDPRVLELVTYRYTGDPKDHRYEPERGLGWVTMSESGTTGLHGLLFTLRFRALEPGTSPLLLAGGGDLGEPSAEMLFNRLLDESSLTVTGAPNTDSLVIPEPSAIVLLGTAIATVAISRSSLAHSQKGKAHRTGI